MLRERSAPGWRKTPEAAVVTSDVDALLPPRLRVQGVGRARRTLSWRTQVRLTAAAVTEFRSQRHLISEGERVERILSKDPERKEHVKTHNKMPV